MLPFAPGFIKEKLKRALLSWGHERGEQAVLLGRRNNLGIKATISPVLQAWYNYGYHSLQRAWEQQEFLLEKTGEK